MNALDLIKNDHTHVQELLAQVEQMDEHDIDLQSRRSILSEIKRELKTHEQMEEMIFYPSLLDEEREIIKDAYIEHDFVDVFLEDLERDTEVSGQQWKEKFIALKELVEKHVQEEESDIFSKAKNILDESTLEELGREMEEFKRRNSSRSRH